MRGLGRGGGRDRQHQDQPDDESLQDVLLEWGWAKPHTTNGHAIKEGLRLAEILRTPVQRDAATSGAASATCTDEIHVFGALTPECKATPQGGSAVKFNVVPNYCFHEGCTYFWDFGDGQSVGGIERPLHVYGAPGGYTATATVKSGGATGTCSINVKVG